jgi:hypothetical protein
MRAIRFKAFGDPSVLELAEVADPAVRETTALVRVMAASINPSEVKNVAGAMKQTTLPRIPGRDFAANYRDLRPGRGARCLSRGRVRLCGPGRTAAAGMTELGYA